MEENKNIPTEEVVETTETPVEETTESATAPAEETTAPKNKNTLYIAIAAAVAVIAIVIALVAGGNKDKGGDEGADNNDNGTGEVGGGADNGDDGNGGADNGEDGNGAGNEEGGIAEGTTGAALYESFEAALQANNAATALELAETLAYNSNLPFAPMAMPIEVGSEFFTGFDSYVITGYSSAAVFMPMIGSIPFVGYVFELADDTDADAFMKALKDNCNPSWNVCVTADQIIAEQIDGKVLFLMCPSTLEEGEEGGDDFGGDIEMGDVIYPEGLGDANLGYSYWLAFEDMMFVNPENTALGLAGALCDAGFVPFMIMPMDIPVGTEYFSGFDNYTIEGYKSAAVFMPMIGSIPFVGYVFELEEGVDAQGFVDDLTANSNDSWLVCETADEKIVGAYDNFVLFLMCPASVEE